MTDDVHRQTEFEPRHPESAEANGVIASPPGRTPAEVDDAALRPNPEDTADPAGTEHD
ncbi:hypothetical protein [Microbacterium sp. E-13]|uniref:hypothetical protein n=1 Tax=Microbacterium sp. E-13 TaxID=3404048 RepID=UPI003CF68ABC